MANLVRKMNHNGSKGDTIRIPTPARGASTAKAAETQVTLIQHGTDAGITVTIDSHEEYSRLIEDIVDVQALESLRSFYTDDGGYAISTAVDTDLIIRAAEGQNASGSITVLGGGAIDSSASTWTPQTGDGTAWAKTAADLADLDDAGIRAFIKLLDDEDAPMMGRSMVIPTIVKQDLLGLSRFTEQAFVGEVGGANTIRNGLIGDVYGVEVFVTTNLPNVDDEVAAETGKLALMFQKDALLFVEQMGVRSQTQYKQEYLADLFTVDMLYGHEILRPNSVVPFVVGVS
jgi:hypothetical protein